MRTTPGMTRPKFPLRLNAFQWPVYQDKTWAAAAQIVMKFITASVTMSSRACQARLRRKVECRLRWRRVTLLSGRTMLTTFFFILMSLLLCPHLVSLLFVVAAESLKVNCLSYGNTWRTEFRRWHTNRPSFERKSQVIVLHILRAHTKGRMPLSVLIGLKNLSLDVSLHPRIHPSRQVPLTGTQVGILENGRMCVCVGIGLGRITSRIPCGSQAPFTGSTGARQGHRPWKPTNKNRGSLK